MEEKILKFWQENQIFEKSLNRGLTRTGRGLTRKDFVFYDGPPFATGLPHYGHILSGIIKDAIPRYQTMKGKRVPRRWGWDCHGLPIENLIEKNLNLQNKKEIEKYGIEKFNKAAQESVLQYADEWKKVIPRIGRWVDMEVDYKTMDWKYTESVWWVFKKLFDKGLIYEGHKPMHICPRCETTLSNFEVTQNYQDIKDVSVTVKFELEDEPGTFVLAWTTTPWTLPGNVALAVNPSIDYAKIQFREVRPPKINGNNVGRSNLQTLGYYILAKDRLEILGDKEYETIKIFKGKDLIGKKYKPLFDYYSKYEKSENCENGWKIYGADFVSTEEGTGVVHIAPAFGEDDMNLGQKEKLPFVQHVAMDGKFKPEVKDFSGLAVKPKEDHQSTDVEIIKYLARNNKLFSKELITHSYPFCWRCDTPLLNYAASSWFVEVGKIKKKLIKNNKKINWIPSHLRGGRFGKWLENARDWAISRSRYWGAPIPVWRCQTGKSEILNLKSETNPKSKIQNSKPCGGIKIIGSLKELAENSKKSGNKYFILRHGEAESNHKKINSCWPEKIPIKMTKKGEEQIYKVVKLLKSKNIDLIFSSDILRTKQTSQIVSEEIGASLEFDERIRELNVGVFNGRTIDEFRKFIYGDKKTGDKIIRFTKTPENGENSSDVRKRMMNFILEIEKKYKNKNILIVSHGDPLWILEGAMRGLDDRDIAESAKNYIQTGELREIKLLNLPYNNEGKLDLHRPYIDKIELACSCGGVMKRVPEVFDCWLESGSMPYGQSHYPFENKKEFEKNFPAEFIAEGIDQTRGWFYTLLVLSTALFNKLAYKNVIVNGIILAENGQKMSKRLNNYPDPMRIVEKYGADALRYYLVSSPAVRGENLNFSEKGVDEVNKKVVSKIKNVLSFYKMYSGQSTTNDQRLTTNSTNVNVLDRWILAKLNILTKDVSEALNNYELDKAVRPIGNFVEDLSNWYVRRSRERFKSEGQDKNNASATLGYILIGLSKIVAPFMPFVAEEIYQELVSENSKQSVHLENWPEAEKISKDEYLILDKMETARQIIEVALALRFYAKVGVRKPLSDLKYQVLVKRPELDEEYEKLISDELNIKKILIEEISIKTDGNIVEEDNYLIIESGGVKIALNKEITPELMQEGLIREFVRKVQDLRKKAGYQPKDRVYLWIESTSEIERALNTNINKFKKEVGAKSIEFRRTEKFDAELESKINSDRIWLGIKKI